MTDNKDNASFDAQVKLMLENAAEPVPAGVWSGVSGALARRERRMGMLLLLRRTSLVVAAAAAAVTAGIFIYGGLSENELPVADSLPVAAVTPLTESAAPVAVETVEVETAEPEISTPVELIEPEKAAPVKVAMAPKKEAVKEEVKVAEAEVKVEVEVEAEVEVKAEAMDIEETATNDKDASKPQESYTFDIIHPEADLLADAGTKPRSAGRLSLNAGGVMESNLSPVQSPISGRRRVSHQTPTPEEPGIHESVSQSEYSLPLSFGAGITWHFSDRWSLGTGLTYTYLGRKFKGTYVREMENDRLDLTNGDIHNSLHYLGIPLTLSYTVIDNRNIQLYGFADGMFEKAISNRFRIEGENGDLYYHESVDGLQYSFGGGVGIRFRLTDHLGLYVDPSLRYYPDCDQPRSIRTQEPLMFSIEAGLRFDL